MYSLRDMFSAHQQSVGGLKNDGFPTIINDESRHCVGARSLGGGGRTGASAEVSETNTSLHFTSIFCEVMCYTFCNLCGCWTKLSAELS